MKRFTLIELSVVVAIIGILISLLLPVLGKARKIARQVTCVSQLRQLSVALYNYTDDNDSHFPSHGYINRTAGTAITWDDLISGYDGRSSLSYEEMLTSQTSGITENQNDLYVCPEDDVIRDELEVKKSYGISVLRKDFPNPPHIFEGIRGISGDYESVGASRTVNEISFTSRTILKSENLSESNTMGNAEGMVFSLTQYNSIIGDGLWSGSVPHSGKFNYSFVDGHVELMNFYETMLGLPYYWEDVRNTMWDAER